MRRMLVLGAGMASFCAGLSACAHPAYPIVSTPTPHPAGPVLAEAAPPQAAVEPVAAPAPMAPSVETKPLPPIGAASAAPQAAPTPPPAATEAPPPEPERRIRTEGRLITNGRVVPATRMFRDYRVQKGDHLYAIARDFQTTAQRLVDANDLESANQLRPGQHLKIPIDKAYVAEAGDTLAAVARRFGVGVGELSDLNDLPARGRLRPGDKIALPAHFEDHGPARLAPQLVEERPRYRPVRPAPGTFGVPASGPYVPSPAAVAEGERRRAEEQAAASQPGAPYRPSAPATSGPVLPSAPPAAEVIAAGRGLFVWPIRGDILSPFGVKGLGRKNDGIDVKSAQGTPVHAAAAGEVVYSGDQVPGFGNLVLIKHAGGWVTAYAHLDRSIVHMRQSVMQGDEIGEVGLSGGVSEPQLHFEVRYAAHPTDKARPVDPELVLPK